VFIGLSIGSCALFAQARRKGLQKVSAVRIPFVPCKSDGQAGPVAAPHKGEKLVNIDPIVAQKLAYYESSVTQGLLAPRGWHCFGVYGSDGSHLYVKPEPIDEDNPFPQPEITGRVIAFSHTSGQGSGRLQVAQVVARVFPKRRDYVRSVIALFDFLASEITYGPYTTDKLTYRSDDVVEYVTPPNSDGLGTMSYIKPNNESVEGFAMLQGGTTPDLLLLVVRLPAEMQGLKSQIVQHAEREAITEPREQ
jgi:hypothetical protein